MKRLTFLFVVLVSLSIMLMDHSFANTADIDSDVLIVDSIDTISAVERNLKSSLITEVENYIENYSQKSRKDIAHHLVEKALDNDIDICFILAQAQCETAFGAVGIGKSRNSLFGVYRTYDSYNHCIDDYISILKSSYLVNGKTEQDLLKNYTNYRGARYAQSTTYECHLSKTYAAIRNSTCIYGMQFSEDRISDQM